MIPLLQPVQAWRLAPLVAVGTLLCAIPTLLVVAVIGLIFEGRVSVVDLLVSLLTLVIVAPPAFMLLGRLLRKAAEQQRALLDHFPFMVWVKDADSRFLAVNQVFANSVGWSNPQALVGKTDLDIWPADLAEPYRVDDRAVLAGGRAISVEEPIEVAGERHWYETYKSPVTTDGRVIGTVGYARDITERKQAEDRLSLAVEVTQIVFWELETASGRLTFDQTQLHILGLEPDPMLDSTGAWMVRLHPDDRLRVRREMAQMRRFGDRIFDVEYRILNRAGAYQWLHTRGRAVQQSAAGRPALMVGTSMNIMARKAIEEAHRLSETRTRDLASLLRLMCDNVPDMIWAKDLDNRYLFTNTAICEQLLSATDTEEPLGKNDRFFGERERARYPDNPDWHTFDITCGDSDSLTLRGGVPAAFEEFGQIKGQPVVLGVHKAPFRDAMGAVIGTVGTAHDITERKRTEHRVNMAVEATRILFWEMDVAEGRLNFDLTLLPILGLESDPTFMFVQGWLDRLHPDDRPQFESDLVRVLSADGVSADFDLEYRLADQSGQYQWLHTRGRVVQRDIQGRPVLTGGTTMNITARKRNEAALRQSEARARDLATLLRLMCDNVPDMIWAKDLDNRFLFTNKAICEQLLSATDTEEPLGKDDRFFGGNYSGPAKSPRLLCLNTRRGNG